ncbi:MAG: hypothetical protein M1832_005746 [Thelocarpon impressellum]|nr:MAG: hypothetical protein M1832_005746 [Thelocarpon impressellum]
MDISGLVSYDYRPRTVAGSASARAAVDMSMSSYSQADVGSMMSFPTAAYPYAQVPQSGYQHVLPNYSAAYSQPGPQHHLAALSTQGAVYPTQALPMADGRQPYPQSQRSPLVKLEDQAAYRGQAAYYADSPTSPGARSTGPEPAGADPNFATDVDTLMKTIQSKAELAAREAALRSPMSPAQAALGGFEAQRGQAPADGRAVAARDEQGRGRKRYECDQPGCGKGFCQKTHLEIHMRAHTGVKPFLCKEPACGQRFSQLGNLKTHERRHTGERPYHCEICGKRFAQRGNVRAHRIVHEQMKPFECRLDDCGKQFTQLGNLKSHQNKFHAAALRTLTQKFASIGSGEAASSADRELWQYFATLYKNSNKGIKGRGKDRKIAGASGREAADDGRTGSPGSQSSHSARGGYDFHADLELDDDGAAAAAESAYLQQRAAQLTAAATTAYGQAAGGYAPFERKLY